MKRPHLIACVLASLVLPAAAADAPTAKRGETVFKANCVRCHGQGGKGDGPSGKVLGTRPANLTQSKAPDDYLKMIITEGGDALGRSADMPVWGGTLSATEIDSVIMHIKTLRQKN